MKRVTILALEHAPASGMIGPMETFCIAGEYFNKKRKDVLDSYFQVELASMDGEAIRGMHGVLVQPHSKLTEITDTDLVIIPGIGPHIEKSIHRHQRVIDWIRERAEQGTTIASNCSGAFLLAETGLLNGKQATTHWSVADYFQQKYPTIELQPKQMIIDNQGTLCSGGASSYFDLSLYLIERFCDRETALYCAKVLLLEIGRTSQAPFAAFKMQKVHQDETILQMQQYIESHYSENLMVHHLAHQTGLGDRQFKRRFKKATGEAPLVYLQRIRIEAAKQILETSTKTIEEISYEVGYENTGFFRKVFKRHTGLAPKAYRSKFAADS